MNSSDQKVIAEIKAMTLEQARKALASGTYGVPGSGNHDFASSWLDVKEAEERDKRDSKTLSVAKDANSLAKEANLIARLIRRNVKVDRIIAITAIIIAIIVAREDIKWLISWVKNIIKTS